MIDALLNKFPIQSIWSLFGVGATSGTLGMAQPPMAPTNHAESLYFICGALCFLGGFLVSLKTFFAPKK
jgi:hypothetical protein